jgi:hypothetical protein
VVRASENIGGAIRWSSHLPLQGLVRDVKAGFPMAIGSCVVPIELGLLYIYEYVSMETGSVTIDGALLIKQLKPTFLANTQQYMQVHISIPAQT